MLKISINSDLMSDIIWYFNALLKKPYLSLFVTAFVLLYHTCSHGHKHSIYRTKPLVEKKRAANIPIVEARKLSRCNPIVTDSHINEMQKVSLTNFRGWKIAQKSSFGQDVLVFLSELFPFWFPMGISTK